MLDATTKKNIDDCRDVLVGKVPDPKSQIEQITLALIYKFMDDMDKEAVEKFKGKAKFFTGDYAKYGWRKLFDPSLSGQDMLALYSEALEKLNTNPNIPELFRNIFKNAYLPYRDPSTLKLFLKYINEFEYSHSEKLGDAFEYLLSVMGSQGDAGQFRTPRHIIDFVTACVNPKKNETVLDPACGTAGFLLSAYKHILNQNTDKRQGDKLKPDDRKKLATHFVGYDISPDMVRLSLANMYLHGFTTPQIHEYDSLSSEDRWQETFDVILANPPFMTPKGGIRPHKKFGVQANKAEVLFTDYIAEHLNTNGRAGIVVPNGIVATSQTAYKQLRKMLVQDSLLAVISLPAGVFQPYSGVKTSVLLLDKKLAKKSQHILFLKIENDGFDLGAQRREIDKNDLPLALQTLEAYKAVLESAGSEDKGVEGKLFDKIIERLKSNNPEIKEILIQTMASLVEKEIVLGNKDIVLSGERYFETEQSKPEFNLVKLGDVAKLVGGSTPSKDNSLYWEKGNLDWITCSDFSSNQMYIEDSIRKITDKAVKENSTRIIPEETLVLVTRVSLGKMAFVRKPTALNQDLTALLFDEEKINKLYAYYFLNSIADKIQHAGHGATVKGVTRDFVKEIEIPLPPLEIQQQIVAEIEGYQKIIDGAKQVVNNYKPNITIKPEWEMVELGAIGKISMCKRIFKEQTTDKGDIPFYKIGTFGGEPDAFISQQLFNEYQTKFSYPKKGDILISTTGTIGKIVVFDGKPAYFQDSNIVWIANNETKILNTFLKICYQTIKWRPSEGVTIARLYNRIIEETKIPFPSIEEQSEIVERIEEEQIVVNGNKKLITLFEQKIKNKINEVWGVKEKETLTN
ncbi:MAG: restriction endonuclease subunit S [Chitinophagaceae bacterium]|nr:restriction endonuclease subunit S [Chitinophagaceae bacterium]